MKDKKEQAADIFSRGFNCSQAVLSVFSEELGITKEDALKIASGFGAGVRQGDICGAVSGAIMALGVKYGHSVEGDSDTKVDMYSRTEDFQNRFTGVNGSLICRELLGFDVTSEKDMETIMKKDLFNTICPKMVKDSVEILEVFLR